MYTVLLRYAYLLVRTENHSSATARICLFSDGVKKDVAAGKCAQAVMSHAFCRKFQNVAVRKAICTSS